MMATQAPVEPEAKPDPGAKRCLIVDDSRVIRKISRRIAENLGYIAVEAENGAEALNRCEEQMPDLILLDWDMPVMTGIEFVEAFRDLEPVRKATVVFCTSKGEADSVEQAMGKGADAYVVKPFDQAALEEKLAKVTAN